MLSSSWNVAMSFYYTWTTILSCSISVFAVMISSAFLKSFCLRWLCLNRSFQATHELPYLLCDVIYSFPFYFCCSVFVFLLGNILPGYLLCQWIYKAVLVSRDLLYHNFMIISYIYCCTTRIHINNRFKLFLISVSWILTFITKIFVYKNA